MTTFHSPFFEKDMSPEMHASIEELQEQWRDVTIEDVQKDREQACELPPTEKTSRAVVFEPQTGTDANMTIVMALPHLQGVALQHVVRARVMQQLIAPDARVVILPNNSVGAPSYDLRYMSDEQRLQMMRGNILPFGEHQMRTLEKLDAHIPLGALLLAGYSLGGRTVLGMTAAGSDRLEVLRVSADETPSKAHRNMRGLQKDFSKSSSPFDVRKSVAESGIDALKPIFRADRFFLDVAAFTLKSVTPQSLFMTRAMTDTVKPTLEAAAEQGVHIKMGFVLDSLLYEDSRLTTGARHLIDTVGYHGSEFRKHTTADNVILHALMVNDGLKLA